jgi:hypothetical protein
MFDHDCSMELDEAGSEEHLPAQRSSKVDAIRNQSINDHTFVQCSIFEDDGRLSPFMAALTGRRGQSLLHPSCRPMKTSLIALPIPGTARASR